MTQQRMLWCVALMVGLAAGRADAVTQTRTAVDGSVSLPGGSRVRIDDAARQAQLESSAPWSGFRAQHGEWHALWNETTASPHQAFGRPIPLAGFANDDAAVDRAVRAFVASHPAVFGGVALELISAHRAGDVWYVRYRQTHRGLPVLFADWQFNVGTNGNLFAFGADVERPSTTLSAKAGIVAAVAREGATKGLTFDPATDRAVEGDRLAILPMPTESGTDYRVVYQVEVRTANPPGNWNTYVDASTGEVLWRQNRVRHNVTGTVTALVQPLLPTDPLVSVPLNHLNVSVDVSVVQTNAAGFYSGAGPNPSNVTAGLRGPYVDVQRADGGPNGAFSTSAANPSTVNIAWGSVVSSLDAERDAFYHVNKAHDYIKGLEPTFTGLDYQMPCAVEVAGSCNAFWDGFGLNFFAAGGGCPDIATIADVVYHEYGHGVNDMLYAAYGGGAMTNGAIHEGMADVNAAFMRDDPVIGRGFMGPGTTLRTIDNTYRWPADGSGDPHVAGLIVGGAFWDLRESVGLAVAEHLAQFSKHSVPDDNNDGVAMNEFFAATLIADDNDANLTNGTPHINQIVAAFNAHGIGTGFSIQWSHTPLADHASLGSIPVVAQVSYTGVIGALDASSPTLYYSINRGAFTPVTMTPTGNPNEFTANIFTSVAGVAQYYMSARDTYGQSATTPSTAPGKIYAFLVGPASTMLTYDMESAAGWIGTAAGDNATTGRWIRADPVGSFVESTPVQPEFDHTATPGISCWVTGNGPAGQGAGVADVDGGRTTLLSPVFSALSISNFHPVIEYYRWYTNNAGAAPSSDFWKVDISNDGGVNWTPVENTLVTENSWMRVLFRIEDYVTPTASMKLRFIAADEGDGSVVEAAVDDFRLLGFPSDVVGVEPGVTPGTLSLAAPAPNPFVGRTTLRFALPASATTAVRVFDINGRIVRTLFQGTMEAGSHSIEWDGRDAHGKPTANGMYFVRVEHGGKQIARAVVRMN